MAQRHAEEPVKSAVDSLREWLDTQSGSTVQALEKMEQHNRNASQHYTVLNGAAEGLKADGVFLIDTKAEITKYVKQLDDASNEVQRLELLVKEMDEWSKELSIKVKRL